MNKATLNMDAFADGQIGSKLWLCEELEKICSGKESTVWVLGGWYATLSFLLLSRERIRLKAIRSFDQDTEATRIADLVNRNWQIRQGPFRSIAADCNALDYLSGKYGPAPDVVINTSCEHFESRSWWKRIPRNTLVALQSTDMKHETHVAPVRSIEEMRELFSPIRVLYSGVRETQYPDWSFKRFMLIGVRE